jgi:integrase/recombinase XerD
MLQCYFVRPATIDRIHDSWIRSSIERYVTWMTERDYAASCIRTRVQILTRFGEFTRRRGATVLEELPEHVELFVEHWVDQHRRRAHKDGRTFSNFVRRPVRQMLTLIIPKYGRRHVSQPDPFFDRAAGYFRYLQHERGLSDSTLVQHRHLLRRFEAYLATVGIAALSELSPAVISTFVAQNGRRYSKRSVGGFCRILKVFLRYLHREGHTARDLSKAVESPRLYRLSDIPRSISWNDVGKVLGAVERCSSVGKRDYAILLLLATYGLRAREIAALTLDDIDWKRDRLRIPRRKAGHSTAFPLSAVVGNAIADYLKSGRPKTDSRRVFFGAIAPHSPTTSAAVSLLAKRYLARAGIKVRRPGSHTLRHSCVQRLLDSHLSIKAIGDYVGHRSAEATQVYTKIDIETLREVSLGDGEAIL